MRYLKWIFLAIALIGLTGCGLVESVFGPPKRDAEDLDDLTLYVNKMDEEAGITLENSDLYQNLQHYTDANPLEGEPNEVMFIIQEVYTFEDGKNHLVFLVENRYARPIEDVEITVTLGEEDSGYIFEKEKLKISAQDYGPIKSDGAIPYYVELDDDQFETYKVLDQLDQDDIEFELDKLKFDYAD